MNATARRLFRPFLYAGQQGRLDLEAVLVDGQPVPLPPAGGGQVDLQDARPRTTLALTARFGLPEAVWETLPEEERQFAALRVVLIAEEAATWVREAVRMTPGEGGVYRASLTLSASDLRDVLELRCVVARATEGKSREARRASELAASLCTSPPLLIRLSEPKEAPGSFMSIRWQAFSEHEQLRGWLGLPWYLQLTADPPVLWLNSELPDVRELLRSEARTGRAAVLRELMFRSIATSIWTTLFSEAARGVSRTEESEFSFSRGWHEQVLGVVAQHAYVDRPKAERLPLLLRRISEATSDADRWPLLHEEVARGLSGWMELGTVFDRAARELTR